MSPGRIGGRHAPRCTGGPNAISVGPTMVTATGARIAGPRPRAISPAEMGRRLPGLRAPGRTGRMPAGDEPAVGGDGHASPGLEVAALDRALGLAGAAKPEQLVVLELLDREGVVHLDEVEILGSEAGL